MEHGRRGVNGVLYRGGRGECGKDLYSEFRWEAIEAIHDEDVLAYSLTKTLYRHSFGRSARWWQKAGARGPLYI